MAETLVAWLRQQREARGWSRREMARQLIQAGRAADDTPMPGMDSMCHNIHRWERGQGGLTERYKLHYCRAFGIRPDQFGADPAAHQSGWAYATAIDHRPLLAHLRLQLASVVFWQNRPRQARDLAEDGLRYLQDGPNAAHLHVKYARAAARLGDAGGARQAIADAQDARDREHSDRVLALGGEFGLSLATQSLFLWLRSRRARGCGKRGSRAPGPRRQLVRRRSGP